MRRAIAIFLLICIISLPALLVSNQQQFMNAEVFAQAGDPDGASAILEALIDPASDEWQKRRIKFDIGTAYLYTGDWKEAIAKLQPLAAENSLSTILEQRLTQNLAYARLLQAKDLWDNLRNGIDANEDTYYSLLILLKQLSLDIEKGRNTQCALLKIEGSEICPPSPLFDQMESESRRLYGAVIASYDLFRTKNTSVQIGVPELLAAVQSFASDLVLLNQGKNDAAWKEAFTSDLLSQMNSWTPLWSQLQFKWKNQPDGDLFEKSYQYFSEAQSALRNHDSIASVTALNNVTTDLETLLKSIYNTNSLQDSTAKLLASYKLALIKDPIQYSSLMAIQEAQNAFETVLNSSPQPNAAPFIKNAQNYLKRSIESYNESKDLNARLYGEAAMSFIRGLDLQLSPASKANGITLLEQVISMQELVKRISLLRFQAPTNQNEMKDIDQLIDDLQNGVVKTAKLFPEASIAQQRLLYDDPGSKDEKCQCSPWDSVVPLFDDGYLKARQASLAFNDPRSRAFTVMLQSQAIEYWKEALAAFHQPKKKKSEEQAKQNEQHLPQSNESNLNDILRYVEQTEKEDRSRPSATPAASSGKEDRPW